jgi:putative transcriptional regulator
MIRSKLKRLRLEKEEKEGRKLTLRVIADETGLAVGTVQKLMVSRFDRIEVPTIEALCTYFECGIGDLLEFIPEKKEAGNGH